MYQINTCSPIWDTTPNSHFNIKLIRILLLVVLLLLFLLYLLIQFFLHRSLQKFKAESSAGAGAGAGATENLEHSVQGRVSFVEVLILQTQQWQREYLLTLGDHSVSIGFVISYSPYQLQLLLSTSYLLIRIIYQICFHRYNKKIRSLKTSIQLYLLFIVLRIINLAMILCAMVGLSRTYTYADGGGVCRDFDYRALS